MGILIYNNSSKFLPTAYVFTKDDETGVVYTQDTHCFMIDKQEAKQLIDGLTKFINEVDDNEIKEHNDALYKKYNLVD